MQLAHLSSQEALVDVWVVMGIKISWELEMVKDHDDIKVLKELGEVIKVAHSLSEGK